MTLDTSAVIGQRVECEGHRGTIKFVGEISGTAAGAWLGVDWDEPTRGKHDGSHKDVSYFTTSHPTSGSFVRPSKVKYGRSCSEAIAEQYEPPQQGKLESMQREAIFKANKVQVKSFEYVGFDKAWNKRSQHQKLLTMDLRCQQISNGNESLLQICPNLIELDIRENLISSWDDLASITKYLPNLKEINISDNKISGDINDSLLPAFANIEHIIAHHMNWDYNDVLKVAKLFPNLVSLYIPLNNVTCLSSDLPKYISKLKILDINYNPIQNWNEILKIVTFNNLQILHLQSIGIHEINFENCESPPFPSLKMLSISDNHISDWSSISHLEKLNKLEDLTFKNNPVLNQENFETNRQLVICRASQLKYLDKIEITDVERRGAALDYLKKYGSNYLKSINDPQLLKDFYKIHPCYQKLIDKYGAPEPEELVSGSTKLKNLLVTILVSCPQTATQINKKIPRTMKIQKLRGILQKHFCPGGNPLVLSYRSQKKPDINFEFHNDLKDLNFYSIEEGDEIIVSW